jgi:streptogramin lyase
VALSQRRIARTLTGSRTLAIIAVLVFAAVPVRAAPAPLGASIDYFFVGSLNPHPLSIAPGPDGNLWFTDSSADAVGRITPDGVVTEFPVGTSKEPYAIVAGADGNLWFTERHNNKVGAVDTDGNLVHEYSVPGSDPRPAGIAAAPNGDIWFTTQGTGDTITNSVGRIRPGGAMTLYLLYPCACFPSGITTGPDGNLWAIEEQGVYQGSSPGTLDKVTPNGRHITRYPVPQQPLNPSHLPAFDAPGPDGNVWFTEFGADIHRIGKVTPTGAMTEYTLPGPITNSVGITTGADGRMWVTQADASRVVVVDTNGTVLAVIPTHHGPAGITVGPDGNVWFAASLDGEIGRLNVAQDGFAYVLDIASGFVPAVRGASLGTTVKWVLEAPGTHQVRDTRGLGLYDSGPKPSVSFQTFTFLWAGTYPYADPIGKDHGAIAVPVQAPATGHVGTPFTVTWADAAPGAGRVFDVQVRLPGSSTWQAWETGVTATSGDYTPTSGGDYAFHARLRGASGKSRWSPPVAVAVAS